jgi:hypothetical protein
MSEKVKVTFKMAPEADEEEKANYASIVKELNSIPDVSFTPEGSLFGIGDTIKGILGIPDVGKSLDKTVGVLGKYLQAREERLGKREIVLEKGKMKVVVKAEGLKEGERERIIKTFFMESKVSRKKRQAKTSKPSSGPSTKGKKSREKKR